MKLVLEVKETELESVTALVVETMESALPDGKPLRVPLRANASYGARLARHGRARLNPLAAEPVPIDHRRLT